MRAYSRAILFSFLTVVLLCDLAFGQAGRRARPAGDRAVTLGVVAARADGSNTPITANEVAHYDDGTEQTILSFAPDPSPARIVLLIDNSLSLRADVERLAQAAREFIYEIYQGDQLLIIGYDERPEIIAPWADDAAQIEPHLRNLRKRGEPHLFDALYAMIDQALRPVAGATKRAVVLISDGLDRGSRTRLEEALRALQAQDIPVYVLQIPDRTGGALRRDQPKPREVIRQLVEATGGRIFPFTEPREAARAICDELRLHRYQLAYNPTGIGYTGERRLLLIANDGITLRAKAAHPPQQ